MSWVVISQHRKEWPPKQYNFSDKAQALMFLDMCRRDGAYYSEIRKDI